ncbi:MAG: BON domain-containing protein [Isosphaeraceae bacterium]|nr:BON domain-containing protein [Isosphaeraceae bacterium]
MPRPAWILIGTLLVAGPAALATAQAPRPASQPTLDARGRTLEQALARDPITGPYGIRVEMRGGRYVLKGRVGTSEIHDVVIRIAIDSGLPFLDEVVTDTREVYRSATPSNGPVPILGGSTFGSANEWVYPEPLFGRLDEPFAGMEPPIISYPPDWNARSGRAAAAVAAANGGPLPPKVVEFTIDPRGVGLLRGKVPSIADRVALGQNLMRTPGVTGIINQLEVDPTIAGGAAKRPMSDTPPPPPRPYPPDARRVEPRPEPIAAASKPESDPEPKPEPKQETEPERPAGVGRRVDPLASRAIAAAQRVPELRGVGLKIEAIEGGIVKLGGRVAGIREAMLAHRAVRSTPGVVAVVDTLEFPAVDPGKPNPLARDVDRAEAELYLESQLGRHLGDAAHVDRVELAGDRLTVEATLGHQTDRARAEAIVKSMPMLRGLRVETRWKTAD